MSRFASTTSPETRYALAASAVESRCRSREALWSRFCLVLFFFGGGEEGLLGEVFSFGWYVSIWMVLFLSSGIVYVCFSSSSF